MKDHSSSNDIQQQSYQQGTEVPLSDELPMSISDNSESNRQNEERIATLEERAKTTGRLMELLTGIIAIITFGGVAIAYFQLKTAKSQFDQDQRPYVISRATPTLFAANQAIMVNLHSGNYGKSPAIKVGGVADIFLGKDALERADKWFVEEAPKVFAHRYETIIPPGTPASHAEATIGTVRTRRVISEEEFNSLLTKDFSVVVVMRQAYLDGIGKQYWTDFCVSYLATNAIVYCPKHNEIH